MRDREHMGRGMYGGIETETEKEKGRLLFSLPHCPSLSVTVRHCFLLTMRLQQQAQACFTCLSSSMPHCH